MRTNEADEGVSLAELREVRRGFDRGNYAGAYEETCLTDFLATRQDWTSASRAGAVLGFFSSYALHEIPATDREEYDAAYAAVGALAVEAGWIKDRAAEYAAGRRGAMNRHILMIGEQVRSYTDVGCYPLFYLTADGGVLCPPCVQVNLELCEAGEKDWRVVAHDINWEDTDMFCDHCSGQIEAAYGATQVR